MTALRRAIPWLGPMALGLALRLPGIATRPVWYDEAFSILLASRPVRDILAGTAADTMPPAYYLALRVWMVAGSSILTLRTLNLILGVLLVGLVFLLARAAFDARAAPWAALLAAISPLLVYHSQELRMYTLLATALCAYAYLLLGVIRNSDPRPPWLTWAGVVGAGVIALYTHNLAVFSIVAPNVYLLIRRAWRTLASLLLAQAAMALLFLPWLVVVPGQVAKIQAAFWTPRPGLLEIVQGIVSSHAALPLPPAWTPLAVAAAVLAFVLTAYLVIRQGRSLEWTGYLITLAAVPPALLFLASHVMRPLYVPRAYLLSLLVYLVLGGWAISSARPRALGWIVGAAFAVAAAVGLPAELAHDTFPRSPFDQAAAYLRDTLEPGDTILHDNKLSYFPMIVYAPDLPQVFLPDEAGSHNDTLAPATQEALEIYPLQGIARGVEGATRVRYVIFQRAIDEYAAATDGEPPALAWLKARGMPAGVEVFNDLWIYEFLFDR